MVVCRWFETHHQTEALGSTGGANWQVWVAPRRSRVLRGLPASHAGVGPRKESHSCRMPAPPLARPLVEASSLCTFLSSILSRDCNRSLSSLGISDNYLFVFIFVSSFFWITCVFVIELMLLCMIVLVLVWWYGESRFVIFVVMLAPTAVLCSPILRSKLLLYF